MKPVSQVLPRALVSSLVGLGLVCGASVALADASLVSVVVCQPSGSPCDRVLVDKAQANLYKTTIQGSIVINSSEVDSEDEAAAAMRNCNQLKRRYEANAQPETSFQCRLEAADAVAR
ncbi:MAG: hypothetical protein IOD12_13755 [Silvanigrellales bacterium]|jgi:hypothetical protein|nr:hypothetical protein [Silvanigrellales bacterium]